MLIGSAPLRNEEGLPRQHLRQRKRARPQIQRAFLDWLDDAEPRLKRRVRVTRRTDQVVEFGFDVGASALMGRLSRTEVEIYAHLRGDVWDMIFWLWIDVTTDIGGYYCSACARKGRVHFISREELWKHELFEPLLGWVNEKLALAEVLSFYETSSGGSTWAQLEDEWLDERRSAVAVCKLRPDPSW